MDKSDIAHREIETVFFGGGTPTLLPASDLVSVLGRISSEFGLKPGAEVTTRGDPRFGDP